MWDKIKNFFSGKSGGGASLPEIRWIDANEKDNPFKVNMLDVQPVTRHMHSASQDAQKAANAVSYGNDDGSTFLHQSPSDKTTVPANLRYPIDRVLYDGQLFVPGKMEHKWAIFFQQGKILFVRSWLRQVVAVADCKIAGDHLDVTSITGSLTGPEEEPAFRVRVVDFLIRSHVLRMGELAPVPLSMSLVAKTAALWCMSTYGEYAVFATPFEYQSPMPFPRPLRTTTRLHLAARGGDVLTVDQCLQSGMPIDLLATDGLAPLHWALMSPKAEMVGPLIDRGSPADVRSDDGTTPLMIVIQYVRSVDLCRFLLDRGADPNAVDDRGFSSLHRACEMGQLEIARLLLERGAKKDLVAQGLTARDLAAKRNETKVIELLDNA